MKSTQPTTMAPNNSSSCLLPHIRIATLMMMLGTATLTANAATSTNLVHLTLMTTSETVLSGTELTDCDPNPRSGKCTQGLASVHRRARKQAQQKGSTVLLLPQLDVFSVLPSMHPDGVEVNLNFYNRINDVHAQTNSNVKVLTYFVDAGDLASGEESYTSLKVSPIKPLSSSMDVPPNSEWRLAVKSAMIVDLTTMESVPIDIALSLPTPTAPMCAILRVDDARVPWTVSPKVSPLLFGTRLGGEHLAVSDDVDDEESEEIGTAGTYSMAHRMGGLVSSLRRGVGLVVMLGYDTTVSPITLLEDMLAMEIEAEYLAASSTPGRYVPSSLHSHLPDIFVDATQGQKSEPNVVNISVTYVTAKGVFINKTREVLLAGIASEAFLDMTVSITDLQAAVGLLSNAVNPMSVLNTANTEVSNVNTELKDSLRDTIYFEDQDLLLTYSRAALANDVIVGTMPMDMPLTWSSTFRMSICYIGECAQGTLVARALRTQLGADIGYVEPSLPRGKGWPAGNITLSHLYSMYAKVDTPCMVQISGLRLWRLIMQMHFGTPFQSKKSRSMQLSGVRITYAVESDGYGQPISIEVFNRTTGGYEPIQRLSYYSMATTNYHCTAISLLRQKNLYATETVDTSYSAQSIQLLIVDYLKANTPYTSLFDNYGIEEVIDNTTEQTYLKYELGSDSCNGTQYFDSSVSTCFDCPAGYEQSLRNVSSCSEIPPPPPTALPTLPPPPPPPLATLPALVVSEKNNLVIFVSAGAGGGLLLLTAVVAVLCEWRRRSGSRSNHNAPNGQHDVAVIFTDIKASTKLWGAAPASMGVALDAHHSLIRGVIGTHRGYEVKTVGDSFMIVVDDAQRAVDLAVAIQNALYDYEWPTAIDDSYSCEFKESVLDDPEEVCGPEDGVAWNGLRVRIGIHYGPVEVILDEVTKGYDYYGTTVNVAARVEGVTDGGQVCASAAVMSAASTTTDAYTSILLAKTALRGVRDEVEVYEIRSKHLLARTFNNPLIFDDNAKIVSQESETHDSSLSTNLTRTSQRAPLTRTTRPIRNIVREAFKVLRGSERVAILEKLRSAWRVELPTGKAFKGITAAQLAKKETKNHQRHKKHPSRRMGNVDTVSLGVHSGSQHNGATSECSSAYSHNEDDDDEDEEDIMFRVIAQRVEPTVATLFNDERRRLSTMQMGSSITEFNLSSHSAAVSFGRKSLLSFNGLAHLFDVDSYPESANGSIGTHSTANTTIGMPSSPRGRAENVDFKAARPSTAAAVLPRL